MKLKLSLKNLAKTGLSLLLPLFFLSCSFSTVPTYLKKDSAEAIQNICQKEYNLRVKSKLVGQTLWVYIPVENLLEKADKPEKFTEKFDVALNEAKLKGGLLEVNYDIKAIPEVEKLQEVKYNKKLLEKINNVMGVLRRVIFSMERTAYCPKFFCIVTADVANGLEMREVFYYLDVKKVFYQFISITEYQHRHLQDIDIVPQAIGDMEGSHIDYRDITLAEFIAGQIKHRIKLKFQKPEVGPTADIDKEVLKIIVNTIKIYDFRDFYELRVNVTNSGKTLVLNQAAVLAKPIE
ncbi:MAG: hypothetical protein NC916_01245 [Candidatus Omnitrophica bacterium]|nr:hypothetical protein [Candidatus Omnitrophota bacterium]